MCPPLRPTVHRVSRRRDWRALDIRFLTPLVLGSTLNPLNSSILATGLVPIAYDMHVSPPAATSLVAVLYLASAVCQPTMGKVSLRWGTRRVFIYGLVLVVIGATLGAVGPNMTYLLVARALIGAGTSAAYPTSIALIRDRAASPNSDVPRMQMAVLAIAGQSTAAIGLPIGGLLIGLAGWRATFLANVPLAGAAIAAALAWLPADRGRHHDEPRRRLDLVGIALFAVAVTSLLVFLEQVKAARWWVAAISVGATAVLVVHELRFEDPFIDVRMLARSGGLRRTYIRNGLSFVAIYTVLYGMSQWLESARDLSPQQCGLVLLPMIVVSGLASLVIARFDVVQPGLVLAGVAISAGGLLLLLCSGESPILLIYAVTVVFGVGMGCTFIANQLALYQQAEGRDIAVATGLLRTSSYVAAIFSSSVIGFAFNGHGEQQGLRVLAWLTAGVGVLVTLSSALDPALNPGKPASKATTG
jgi:MFS family permease